MTKHWIISDSRDKARYVCNQAVTPIFEKIAMNANEITCKNCRRFYQKHVGDIEHKDVVEG